MASPIVIRPATQTDAPAIAQVHVASWQTTYKGLLPNEVIASRTLEQRVDIWTRVLTQYTDRQFTFVAVEDDKVVGFSNGGKEREGDPTYTSEIYSIYLLAEAQRKGVGRRLLVASAKALLGMRHTTMIIWVLKDNPAEQFYTAIGGEPLKEKTEMMGDTQVTEIGYCWMDIRPLAALETGRDTQ